MKAKYFFLLPILAIHTFLLGGQSLFAATPNNIVAVVREDRVHILLEETPVKDLVIEVHDQLGKVVYTQVFHTDAQIWYFDLPQLPTGSYTIEARGQMLTRFEHKDLSGKKAVNFR